MSLSLRVFMHHVFDVFEISCVFFTKNPMQLQVNRPNTRKDGSAGHMKQFHHKLMYLGRFVVGPSTVEDGYRCTSAKDVFRL